MLTSPSLHFNLFDCPACSALIYSILLCPTPLSASGAGCVPHYHWRGAHDEDATTRGESTRSGRPPSSLPLSLGTACSDRDAPSVSQHASIKVCTDALLL
jgi:hypothetical protein